MESDLRIAIHEEDVRFREELKARVLDCEPDEMDAVIFNLSEASKGRQREILRSHHWGESILRYPVPAGPPRAA